MKAICVSSGGMDSTVLAYLLKDRQYDLTMLSFNYGQKHVKETEFAERTAQKLEAEFLCFDLSGFGKIATSALTSEETAVPDGHYEDATMKKTVVPNRNAVMLSIAYSLAVSRNADIVAAGIHAGDHAVYPDCRPEFASLFDKMQRVATEGFGNPNLKLFTPFVTIDKTAIAKIGSQLNVPFEETWSCYKGGEIHCGTCGTCVERIEALSLAGVEDKTIYAH